MQVNTRLDEDLLALMVLLEKNRDSILKILVDIGMPLDDESAEWEGIVERFPQGEESCWILSLQTRWRRARNYEDDVLDGSDRAATPFICAKQRFVCNHGKREKAVTIPLMSVERKLTFLAFVSIGAISARMRRPNFWCNKKLLNKHTNFFLFVLWPLRRVLPTPNKSPITGPARTWDWCFFPKQLKLP